MFAKRSWSYLLALLIVPLSALNGEDKRTFSQPDSVLLLATYGELRVVTPDRVLSLKPPVEVGYNDAYFVYPSLAPRGDLVAWGFAVAFQKNRASNWARFALGVYSIKEEKWKTYGDFDDIGTPAFSPDGSKIAFVAVEPIKGENLLIFDVASEEMRVANVNAKGSREKGGIPEKATLGWSPDGKRLVVEFYRSKGPSLIAVIDPSTAEVKPIGEGTDPAWSPTGEWIAYHDEAGKKCMLVHPDGTGTKIAREVHSTFVTYRRYGYAVVWSPDGKKLLLNEMKGDFRYINTDIVLLDLETGRSTTKAKNGLAAFGWASRSK